jgi:carbonic anhydrase
MHHPFEDIVAANREYVVAGQHRSLPVRPSRQLVMVTCMDSRIDAFASLGLELGEAHVIRTAGARVTEDVLRSLTLSTHVLGTRAVMVIGHTDCGLADPDGTLIERLTAIMGRPPVERPWGAFSSPAEAVAEDCELLAGWSDRPDDLTIAGYVLDVRTGALGSVVPPRVLPPRQAAS